MIRLTDCKGGVHRRFGLRTRGGVGVLHLHPHPKQPARDGGDGEGGGGGDPGDDADRTSGHHCVCFVGAAVREDLVRILAACVCGRRWEAAGTQGLSFSLEGEGVVRKVQGEVAMHHEACTLRSADPRVQPAPPSSLWPAVVSSTPLNLLKVT